MPKTLIDKLKGVITNWLVKEPFEGEIPLCDFDRIQYELRPCDVILIEGKSRVSDVIRKITQSPWTHSALYIGRLHDISNPVLRQRVNGFHHGSPDDQLIIESMLGQGTIVSPLSKYENAHIRICRPKGLSRQDAQQVIGFGIGRLGTEYGVRHILDLARFLLPWSILPKRFRSTIFEHNIGVPTQEICSSMIAEAFSTVHFPILPFVSESEEGYELYPRNPKLFTPSDFDYSPYFEIIKYPIFEFEGHPRYRSLNWKKEEVISEYSELIRKKEAEAKQNGNVPEDTIPSEDED